MIKKLRKSNRQNFLGIYIDSTLTWKQHINYIKDKISKLVEYFVKQDTLYPLRY